MNNEPAYPFKSATVDTSALGKARALYRIFADQLHVSNGEHQARSAMTVLVSHLRSHELTLEQVISQVASASVDRSPSHREEILRYRVVALESLNDALKSRIRLLEGNEELLRERLDEAKKDVARAQRQVAHAAHNEAERRLKLAADQVCGVVARGLSGMPGEPLIALVGGLFSALFAIGPKRREEMVLAALKDALKLLDKPNKQFASMSDEIQELFESQPEQPGADRIAAKLGRRKSMVRSVVTAMVQSGEIEAVGNGRNRRYRRAHSRPEQGRGSPE